MRRSEMWLRVCGRRLCIPARRGGWHPECGAQRAGKAVKVCPRQAESGHQLIERRRLGAAAQGARPPARTGRRPLQQGPPRRRGRSPAVQAST